MGFTLIPFLIQLAIGIAISVIGYLLTPKPKAMRPEEVKDLDNPTAEGGRPVPVVFGEMDVTGINVIWFGDKHTSSRKINA